MKIQAVSNQYSIKRTRQNVETKQDLTGFTQNENTQENPIESSKAAEAIKSNFLSKVSFKGHKEEFSKIPRYSSGYCLNGGNYIYGTSGAVHTRLTDPKKDLTTHNISVQRWNWDYYQDEQDNANQSLIRNSSSFYPNSSIENTSRYRTGYKTERVYFADPEEVVPDQTKKDFDYIVYDNRPVYPRLEDVKKNYFDYDYIPSYYWDNRDSSKNYGQYFKTIAEYYYRLEAADRRELEKLKKEKAEFENEYQTSAQYKHELEDKKNEFPWQNSSIDQDKEKADYFYYLNEKRYNDLSQKIGYYTDRINFSKMQEQKAIQAFRIFDEVGLMFMDRDNKRKQVVDAKATIDYDTQKIKEYDAQLQTYYPQKEEIGEQLKIAKEWKALNDKKANSPAQSYDNEHDYYERREREEYDKKDREYAENESKNLAKKIAIWEDKLKKINIKISQIEYCKRISQNSIQNAQDRIPVLEAEIKIKSDEIKSFYPKMEEFYKNNVEEWQYNQ